MRHLNHFYIDHEWVAPCTGDTIDVVNPASEECLACIASGTESDIERAILAARRAFPDYSRTAKAKRVQLLKEIARIYFERQEEFAKILSEEMGAPISLARSAQVMSGYRHLLKMVEVLESFEFRRREGSSFVAYEPVGVCGLITPWNWPLNQIICKIAPALAAGCTMVLKPSEIAPLNALILAEVLDEAGVPAGVFNLVNGRGNTVGRALAGHPDIDMISFTGSTVTGIEVAKNAAVSIKRTHQELGGKSSNLILPSANLEDAVARGVAACFRNSGQSCNSPARLLVPEQKYADAVAAARNAASSLAVGRPSDERTQVGPLASRAQFEKVQHYIELGLREGAELIAGGPGKPEGLGAGYYVRPTIFGGVTSKMRIAQEEIFGPVLSILSYSSEAEAIDLANDTDYGLAAYIQGNDPQQLARVASLVRAGTIYVNYPSPDFGAPFGGFKKSGNGREYGRFGLESYLEIKGVVGLSGSEFQEEATA